MKARSSDWWERIVLAGFSESDWVENFKMGKDTFMYVCNQLRPHIKKNTVVREPISVEKRVAVTILVSLEHLCAVLFMKYAKQLSMY